MMGEAHMPVTGSQWYESFAARHGAENVTWSALPAYTGGKTTGVLATSVGDIDFVSGWAGPGASMPRGAAGFNIITRSHVEGHAAAAMQNLGLTDGTLYLNRIPCGGIRGCDAMLPRMLGPGSQLRVVVPGQMDHIYVGAAQ
jgi:hypothetical protein